MVQNVSKTVVKDRCLWTTAMPEEKNSFCALTSALRNLEFLHARPSRNVAGRFIMAATPQTRCNATTDKTARWEVAQAKLNNLTSIKRLR